MNNIYILENYVSSDVCERYVNAISHTDWWEKNNDYDWHNRSINLHSMPLDIKEELLDIRCDVKQKIINQYNVNDLLYSDLFQFVRWQVGNKLYPHADAENPDGSPHPMFYRNYASVIYLNDNYIGGEIYFPNFDNFKPKIKPGTLVMFPSTLRYLHGVTEITEGTRYTIVGFFTFNERYKDGNRI